MVLFNSNLVHATQPLRFHGGYKNRRINLTWLFGHPDWIKEKDRKNEEHLRFATNFVNGVFPPSKKKQQVQYYSMYKNNKKIIPYMSCTCSTISTFYLKQYSRQLVNRNRVLVLPYHTTHTYCCFTVSTHTDCNCWVHCLVPRFSPIQSHPSWWFH